MTPASRSSASTERDFVWWLISNTPLHSIWYTSPTHFLVHLNCRSGAVVGRKTIHVDIARLVEYVVYCGTFIRRPGRVQVGDVHWWFGYEADRTGDSIVPSGRAAEVVNAVVTSTLRYLEFLLASKKGVDTHRANGIRPAEEASVLLENTTWNAYYCKLPRHLSLWSDSAATLRPDAAPANEIEIRISDYDRRTGKTEFRARTPVPGNSGNIVIDFRWLVQRCLDWFRQNGSSVPDVEEIKPSHLADPSPSSETKILSDEQRRAITTLLSRGLSYIWGPPGTGKTERVLARTVSHCVQQKEKVLVVASTNLAVDHALSAIMETGVPKEQVARIGIPSKKFINENPECCEARAFQREIQQIKSQITTIEKDMAALARIDALRRQVREWEADLAIKRKTLTKDEASLAITQEELGQFRTVLNQCTIELEPLHAEYRLKQRQLAELAVPKLLSHVGVLESEQTRTIGEIVEENRCLSDLGVFTRIFTRRKQRSGDLIAKLRTHLRSVEATLTSLRDRLTEVVPLATRLGEDITTLGRTCEKLHTDIGDLRNRIREIEKKLKALRLEVAKSRESVPSLERNLESATGEISRTDERYVTDQADTLLGTWRTDKDKLEKRLTQFKQDLTTKSVLGMTLDGFIGFTLNESLVVNRVFVDEAPFAPVAKVIPLLSLRCPVAMLGDHRQLPPVCECNNDAIIRAYWAQPAIYLEDAYRLSQRWAELCDLEEPRFHAILRTSYRYTQELASLLGKHVYNDLDLVGQAEVTTRIEWVDCQPKKKEGQNKRENHAEVEKILDQLEKLRKSTKQPDGPKIVILTPYKNQVALIRKAIKTRFGIDDIADLVEVWNTHKAQGREWDWVLFSVSDTANLPENQPYFTDSTIDIGKRVLNTTISRAKQRLIVFLDANYWKHREHESLLTDLVRRYGDGSDSSET